MSTKHSKPDSRTSLPSVEEVNMEGTQRSPLYTSGIRDEMFTARQDSCSLQVLVRKCSQGDGTAVHFRY